MVDAVSIVSTSVQFIIIPFRSVVIGLISNLDTNGNSFWVEILEKVKVVEYRMSDHFVKWLLLLGIIPRKLI